MPTSSHGDRHRSIHFGGQITAHATFNGLTIPSAGRFGWYFGTNRWSQGEFFRYRITELRLAPARVLP
jgi:hypothetical protein